MTLSDTSFGPSALATPANAVTITRLLLAIPLLMLIADKPSSYPATALWIILCITDGIDGYLAPARHHALRRVPRSAGRQGARARRDGHARVRGSVLVATGGHRRRARVHHQRVPLVLGPPRPGRARDAMGEGEDRRAGSRRRLRAAATQREPSLGRQHHVVDRRRAHHHDGHPLHPRRQSRNEDNRVLSIDIEDLGAPRLPPPLRAANAALSPFAARVRLDEDSLVDAARKRAKLHDLGPDTFRDGFSALTTSLDREAGLSPLGRMMARQLIVQLLVTRLRLFELLRMHPEITDEPVEAPIFIIGLPRTGTTHLHTAMSHDERLRSMPYWESLDPIPDPHVSARPEGKLDPRIARCAQGLRLVHYAMPLFPAMHEMSAEGPHEEIQLLAVDFETMFFEAGYNVPSYVDWYRAHDQTGSYRLLRTLLQAMQWLRGGRRWVLKSPQHLEQLPALLEVFPDAVVVQTHRDPSRSPRRS